LEICKYTPPPPPPIFKKGKKEEVENFRPVSLLPVISKVQEKCVANRLIEHVSGVLHNCQHGFQAGKTCATQLLQAFHIVGRALDKGKEVDIIFLDFAKAFDSVCHVKLLSKLRLFGVEGPLLDWFRGYLSNGQQRVVINGTHSSWVTIGSGFPQGSILGPILFLLFVNDMPEVISKSLLFMFADDSKCLKVINSLDDCVYLQSDLDRLYRWKMKCHNLRISRKQWRRQASEFGGGI
jgi:hypothetical protein